jgi:hypothetical protein
MSEPVLKPSEADQAERQRKTFRGLGCSAGALAVFGPFIFGYQFFGMIPTLILLGLIFMGLGIAARRRRDRAWLAEPPEGALRGHFAPATPSQATSQVTEHSSQQGNGSSPSLSSTDPEAKLNERLNKAKKAGL